MILQNENYHIKIEDTLIKYDKGHFILFKIHLSCFSNVVPDEKINYSSTCIPGNELLHNL